MARKYELKRRAERQAQTRRRIVEAAIDLHQTKGPARTTLSDIARRAGVQRHTLYRHFPDERTVGMACSDLYMQLHPPPEAAPWRSIADPEQRLRRGLTDLYGWFDHVRDMLGSVLRDAEIHPLTAELFQLRAGDSMISIREGLAEGLPPGGRAQAALDLALDFYAWRRLARSGLSQAEAVETMVAAVRCQ
jgi:AcrR family transcriptional regulator